MTRVILCILLLTPGIVVAAEVPNRPLFKPSSNAIASNQPLHTPRAGNPISGFMYFSPDKWSFWLYGQRISPGNVPTNITDLTVTNDSITYYEKGEKHHFAVGKF